MKESYGFFMSMVQRAFNPLATKTALNTFLFCDTLTINEILSYLNNLLNTTILQYTLILKHYSKLLRYLNTIENTMILKYFIKLVRVNGYSCIALHIAFSKYFDT